MADLVGAVGNTRMAAVTESLRQCVVAVEEASAAMRARDDNVDNPNWGTASRRAASDRALHERQHEEGCAVGKPRHRTLLSL